jgi:hypothetical protein
MAHFGLLQFGAAAVKKMSAPPMMADQPASERTEHFFERADRAVDILNAPF